MLRNVAVGLLRQRTAALALSGCASCALPRCIQIIEGLASAPGQPAVGPQIPRGFAVQGIRGISSAVDPQVKEAARSALLEYASSKGGSKITPEVFEEICGGAAVGPAALKQLKSELEDAGVLLHDEKGVYICSPTVAKAVAEAVEEASKAGQEGKGVPEDVKKAAERRASLATWGVLGLMGAHFGAFFWGTYIEYSWDVTEPLAFFSQMVVQLLAFMYFLWTRNDFSNSTLWRRAHEKHVKRMLRRLGRS